MTEKDQNVNVFMMTILIVGLLGGMGVNIWLIQLTFIRVDTVFHIAIIAGALSIVIYYAFFRHLRRYAIEVILYSILGWGSILAALFLTLNYTFHKQSQTLTYGLENGAIDLSLAELPVEINVKDSLFKGYHYMLRFDENDIAVANRYVDKADFKIAEGLFGYKILLDKELH